MTAEQTGDLLRALADPSRLRLLALLRVAGTLCVCELEQITGLAQYAVSRNLGILRRAGLLRNRRNGARMDYELAPNLPAETLALLDCTIATLHDDALLVEQQAAAALLRSCCGG